LHKIDLSSGRGSPSSNCGGLAFLPAAVATMGFG
jgi:hypothetical protein